MKPRNIFANNDGFIALISSIIIAVLLMAITFALGFSGFFSRVNVLDVEFKERSIALAEACADTAIISLQADPSYVPVAPPGDPIPVGSETCHIWSIGPVGSWPKIVKVQGIYPSSANKKSYTNFQIVVSKPSTKVIVNSWEEIPSLP
ncbi:MAG: hypothetical protein HY506_02220 [Candidatus Yanofskybacteria bacterium]|nr:hypothetical protein [Candidatus Yanofskybacteria bacterium]